MNYVGVRLQVQYNNKTYWYLNELYNIEIGDYVVVPTNNLLQVAEVLQIRDNMDNHKPTKYIVDKVDTTMYKDMMDKCNRKNEIKSKITERVNYLKDLMTLEKLVQEDVILANLVDELNKEDY